MADVQLKQIKKSYGQVNVLHGIDLDIKHGEFVVLVGASGCGKSTLLRLIAGLEDISGGELLIDNKVVNHQPPAKRGIAMVFQSYALYPHMSVFKNMAFGLKISGKDKNYVREKVEHAAKILQIDHLLERLPRELSGGQRQRVAIGRAIVRDPNVFLFDEPLSNLDAALRVQTRVEIGKLHKDLDATIIYVTHDQVEAMTLGDKIVVMNKGRVEQCGSPLELYRHPRTQFVAGFIGSPKMNFMKGKVSVKAEGAIYVKLADGVEVEARVESGAIAVGEEVTVGVRPEHLQESLHGEGRLKGKINLVEHLGEVSYIYMTLTDGSEVVVRGDGETEVKVGDEIYADYQPQNVHVFNAQGLAFKRLTAAEADAPAAAMIRQAAGGNT
ncbi:sn-glycerol-3-phosphate ABC transporter ATP-binding protein UgpC [Hahella sp. KA22]|uniref:ABC transporter ATP-binding protein n=1 Tax=Hahella sp. KA22 TaxID=1628392 RepID=UPI000FDD7581|nr:sn-glycerol-3-phosphate ABC transporter ATP-binding protein UgpC [Hahella sp. KA22]AZZ95277.1 sn-glycerol-3-phosphate ABC transporter ATP-binding protein UgpC [Hahella sp. KA22]QAY52922.1 sn-glycerol-3-phosphate ABC transporter ATP-binding protein UgpC [Hahella sp. KA22]